MLMAFLPKRWYRTRRSAATACVAASLLAMYYTYALRLMSEANKDITRRHIERQLQEALKADKGSGCQMPELDPFSKEVMQFDTKAPDIKCYGQDWVRCYHSKCRVIDAVKETVNVKTCTFKDIIYHSDQKYSIGPPTRLDGDGVYELKESDHVKVACVGTRKEDAKRVVWSGNTLGLRPVPAPALRRQSSNVVILAFDSTSRNGFIRKMPKSWRMLKDIGATVLDGYNVVGDGTPAALFPLLTGKAELELPDARKSRHNKVNLDSFPFIFYKLKEDGYRTAYFEDSPDIGTFQYRFRGFNRQPTDHYLRALFTEDLSSRRSLTRWLKGDTAYYCLGDTPQYRVMMNITEQFLDLDGKLFIFTFIADISHDDFNMIQNADDDMAALLDRLSRAEDTLIVVMGDHGPRYAKVRSTLQGKLEERLPLLAIRLPQLARRLHARTLSGNAHALCTPHDLHATILDVIGLRRHWNTYRVPGADYARGLSLLEPIPRNRSCSEAGIEPHWCACLVWQNVSTTDRLFEKSASALIGFINSLVATAGGLCIPRTLISTSWVLRQRANNRLLAFRKASRRKQARFDGKTSVERENYQIGIVVGPGHGTFEATMSYIVNEDKFIINTKDISRTNAYSHEPDCISDTHPHLSAYCYCR